MADLTLPDFAALDPAAVAAAQAEIAARLAAAFPGVDLSRGLYRDLALELGGALYAGMLGLATTLDGSMSLRAALADPAAADAETVDRLLSNFRVARRPAAAASGRVAVLVAAAVPLVIPAGATFVAAGGAAFAAAGSVAVRVDASTVTGATDVVLAPSGSGYAFSVPATALVAGAAGMIRSGQALTPGFPLPGLVAAYAAGDFVGGADAEDTASLLARLQAGVAAPTFSGRGNVAALLGQSGPVAGLLGVAVVGAGDPEMLRDRRSIFPVASFGRCDVYARTAPLPSAVSLAKTATYLGPAAGGGGTWQLTLAAADAPGFYEVASVVRAADPPGTPTLPVVADVRGFDLTAPGWAPDVASAAEAAYSAYQTAVIRFVDARTPTAGLVAGASTAPYTVGATASPGIAALQAFLGGRDVRPAGGDVLARAAVPCFLRATVTALVPAGPPADTAAVAAAVAAAANRPPFAGTVYLAGLASAALAALPPGSAVAGIECDGRLRRPDGVVLFLRDPLGVKIAAPDDPAAMTTPRTVAFFLDPADVVVVAGPLPPQGG